MPKPYPFAALILGIAAPALAQQPPVGLAPIDLPQEPQVFASAEQPSIEATVLAKGFARPFALDFLPNGDLLVTERGGNLLLFRQPATSGPGMQPEVVGGMTLPPTGTRGMGLQDVSVRTAADGTVLVAFTYNDPVPNAEDPDAPPVTSRFQLRQGAYRNGALADVETLFSGEESRPSGSRIAFAVDGSIFLTTGAPSGATAQDLASVHGKVLRLEQDGRPHADNPLRGRDGAAAAIYSYGHRDQLGLAIHASGAIFAAEHGPNGGDEVNMIEPGGNYGWPVHSWGRNYDGAKWQDTAQAPGVIDPVVVWNPSIAPSGLMFYTGSAFPGWKGNLFVGSSRSGEINGTGGLERVVFNDSFGELRRESLFGELHQRVRDVVQGPDGLIYLLTDGPENAILRIAPGK